MTMRELATHGVQLKAEGVFVLRSDVDVRPSNVVESYLRPGGGRLDMQEVSELNISGMLLSRDPAQVVRARVRRAEGARRTSGVVETSRLKKRRVYTYAECDLQRCTGRRRGLGHERIWGCC